MDRLGGAQQDYNETEPVTVGRNKGAHTENVTASNSALLHSLKNQNTHRLLSFTRLSCPLVFLVQSHANHIQCIFNNSATIVGIRPFFNPCVILKKYNNKILKLEASKM